MDRLQPLPTNIRLGCKGLQRTNTPAYFYRIVDDAEQTFANAATLPTSAAPELLRRAGCCTRRGRSSDVHFDGDRRTRPLSTVENRKIVRPENSDTVWFE